MNDADYPQYLDKTFDYEGCDYFYSYTTLNILQYVNNIIATFFGAAIHIYILIKIAWNYSFVSHYQNFLMIQSVVYFAHVAITFFLNNISIDIYAEPVGQPFLPLSDYLRKALFSVSLAMTSIEIALGSVFNIYRTFTILRPSVERTLLLNLLALTTAIIIVLTTSSACSLVIGGIKQELHGFEHEYELASTVAAIIPTISCYILIERHFKNLQISQQVKKMQSKLSLGFVLQLIFQTMMILAMCSTYVIYSRWLDKLMDFHIVFALMRFYSMIMTFLQPWPTAVNGFIIRWSISGLLAKKNNRVGITSVFRRLLQQS